jgi:hypothetical protein
MRGYKMEQKTQESNMAMQFVIAVTIISISAIAGLAIYNVNDRNLMAKNIEQAITKGVDPLSVKCSYQTHIDPICITYSTRK